MLALMHSSDREWSPGPGPGGAHSAVFFSGSSGARHELFLSGSSSFLFCLCSIPLSYRCCCWSYRERSSISSTSTWKARPARAAGAGTKPAAQLIRRRNIIGIGRDTGYNRARERAPRGRGRGRADRSPRRLVYLPRVRGAEEGVLGDSPKRRVSKLIVFTSTCTLQKRPLRTADVISEPSRAYSDDNGEHSIRVTLRKG